MAMPLATDKRFRRARVRPAGPSWRRLSGRTAAAAAGGALVLIGGLVWAAVALRHADALVVTRIAVTGHTWLARGEILTLVDGLSGTSIATVDLEPWRARLLGSPWVADVSLRRLLPDTIAVRVVERQPMALARLGGALYLIDREARIIDLYGPPYATLDLPIVDGLARGTTPGGADIDGPRAALAGRLLGSLARRPDLAARVSQIDVSDPRDPALLLAGDTARVRIGQADAAERLETYLEIAGALREQVPDIDYVDMRIDGRVAVGPQRGSGADPGPASPGARAGGRS